MHSRALRQHCDQQRLYSVYYWQSPLLHEQDDDHRKKAYAMYIFCSAVQCWSALCCNHQTRIRPKAWVLPSSPTSTGDLLAFHKDDDVGGDNDVGGDDDVDGHNVLITIFPWKPFVNLGLHLYVLLCCAGLSSVWASWATLPHCYNATLLHCYSIPNLGAFPVTHKTMWHLEQLIQNTNTHDSEIHKQQTKANRTSKHRVYKLRAQIKVKVEGSFSKVQ